VSTAGWALDVSCRIVPVGILIGAFEQCSVRGQLRPGGILFTPAHRESTVRRLLSHRTLAAFVTAQVATAVVVIVVGVQSVWGWGALCVLTVAFIGLRWYRRVGGDGAAPMASVVLIATVLVAPACSGEVRVALAAGFIAAPALGLWLARHPAVSTLASRARSRSSARSSSFSCFPGPPWPPCC